MNKLFNIFFPLALLLFSVTICHGAVSDQEVPEEIAQRLQDRYDKITSLSFNFFQNSSGEMTGRPRKGTGKAAFVKLKEKSYMRWDYSSPDQQVLVSDGELFSMYFAKLQQMIVSPAESLNSDLTYSFFTGRGKLLRDFDIREPDDFLKPREQESFKVIKLIPKSDQTQVQDIHLWVTDESLIRRINIRDHFGTETVLNFTDIVVDKLIDKSPQELLSLFTFTPPEGTEIIRQ